MMRMTRICLALCIIAALLVFSMPLFAAGKATEAEFVSDQILVKFKSGTVEDAKGKVHKKYGGEVISEIQGIGVQVVKVPAGKVLKKVNEYIGEDNVEFAEPDYIVEAAGEPNDTDFGKQWGMRKILAPEAWDITSGSADVKIAIVDSGIYSGHPDLAGQVAASANFTRSRTVEDKYGHGTHVAGIAAAVTDNGRGVASVAYGCTMLNVKVLEDNGRGSYSALAAGICWAADNGAKVINMSLSGPSPDSTLESAVNYAWNRGVVLVAAAGNAGTDAPQYPAGYANVIAVAATDENDGKPDWSCYGGWVDVAAPGVDIYSTIYTKRKLKGSAIEYVYASGTSMAAPHVAGVAALVFGRVTDSNGDERLNDEVRTRIQSTADNKDGTITWCVYGRIDAYEAVK